MHRFLPGSVFGILSTVLVIVNTVIHVSILSAASVIKVIIPINKWRNFFGKFLTAVATNWVFMNNLFIRTTINTKWVVEGLDDLDRNGWYLVISNHQSNLDIVVLQKIFYKKIPFLKFFIKSELIWVPLLGLAWWALDFPFMKRYSKEYLEKNPQLKGKDIEATKKACEKFKIQPISIVNFVEGTRYSPAKASKQNSPYNHLLKPKAGGLGYVISAMGDQLNNIIDVSIVYPSKAKSLWDFFCSRVNEIHVNIRVLPIDKNMLGDYVMDDVFRNKFHIWLNDLWEEKNIIIESMSQY